MEKVYAMYFSATGTTKKTVLAVAQKAAEGLGLSMDEIDFTKPGIRQELFSFTENDLVVFGTPVYAGRVPNVLLKFLETVVGGNALAVPIVSYGNRNYDDALIELRNILEADGFKTIGGGAFVGEHSFSYTLGAGRPNEEDRQMAQAFGTQIADKIKNTTTLNGNIEVKGETPIRPYYTPRDRAGNPVDIRKVTPKVNFDKCNNCKACVRVCPMGSIVSEDVSQYKGICIKCGACIKRCLRGARYYDSESYLYHKQELEEEFSAPKKVEIFI